MYRALAQRLLILQAFNKMIDLDAPEWWLELPVLTGQSLYLREVEAGDVDTLFELLTDPLVSRYISPPPPTLAAFAGFIEWAHRQREAGSCVCFAVVPSGLDQAIGLFQVRALEPAFRTAEWGFALGAAFWSTGLFQEAAALVAEFAFGTIGVHRLEGRAVVGNGRGNRALEKLGAKGEAVLRKAFKGADSQFLWGIVAEEWTTPKAAPRTVFDAAKIKRQIARAIAQYSCPGRSVGSRVQPDRPFPFFLTKASDEPPEEN
jgi:[ribosomal protein S5]-alanine N-acetyltransferase